MLVYFADTAKWTIKKPDIKPTSMVIVDPGLVQIRGKWCPSSPPDFPSGNTVGPVCHLECIPALQFALCFGNICRTCFHFNQLG